MRSRHTGFTLIELLVVTAIVSLLLVMALPALSNARRQAKHVQVMAGLREMLMGYTQYQMQNRGSLLYGYTPATVNGSPITVTDRLSGHAFGLPVADRYPWRLAPYVANFWDIMHIHEEVPPLPMPGDSPSEALQKAYTLSINPTFGINSVYVGGHAGPLFQGFVGDRPNLGRHVVFRVDEVRLPWQLIVFAECQARNAPFAQPDAGLHYVMPPRANGRRWRALGDDFEVLTGVITGVPKGRFSRKAAIGFFDGHVDSLSPGDLENMMYWANWADAADYDFASG